MNTTKYLSRMLFLGVFVVCLGNSAYAELPLPDMFTPGTGWDLHDNGIITYYTLDLVNYRDWNTTEKSGCLESILDLYDEGNEIWVPTCLEESATLTCNCHGYIFLGVSSWTGSGWIGNGVIIGDLTAYLTSGKYSINNTSGDVCRFSGHSAYHCGLGKFVYWAKMSSSAPWAYHSSYGSGSPGEAYGPHYERWCENP